MLGVGCRVQGVRCRVEGFTSGARYCGVPERVVVPGRSDITPSTFESPKSATCALACGV